jgi:hypothetical protein
MPQSTPESIALPENSRRISWLSISEFNSESIYEVVHWSIV